MKIAVLSGILFNTCWDSVVAYPQEAQCIAQVQNDKEYHPIRIRFEYFGFAPENSAHLDLLQNTVFPNIASYWSKTLKVRKVLSRWLLYDRPCSGYIGPYCVQTPPDYSITASAYECGDVTLNLSENDMDELNVYDCGEQGCSLNRTIPPGSGGSIPSSEVDLYIRVVNQENDARYITDDYQSLANVVTCGVDECGRPTIGVLRIYPSLLKLDRDRIINTLTHEIAHILGFTVLNMSDWVFPETGLFQQPLNKRYRIAYFTKPVTDSSSRFESAAFFQSSLNALQYSSLSHFISPYHVIKKMSPLPGTSTSPQCTCPMDPNERFTDSDLLNCLNNVQLCSFLVTAPRVVAAAQSYYGCEDDVRGMPLHVQPGSIGFLNPHWSQFHIHGELMNAVATPLPRFMSQMTLALLEASGWYRVDYSAGMSALVPGIMWAHKDGCAILRGDYVDYNTGRILSLEHTRNEFNGQVAADYVPHQACFSNALGHAEFIPSDNGNGLTIASEWASAVLRTNYQERCIDSIHVARDGSTQTLSTTDVTITCRPDLLSYKFLDLLALLLGDDTWVTCTAEGQMFQVDNTIYICRDPKIICAKLNYKHLPSNSPINNPPGIKLPLAQEIPPVISLEDVSLNMDAVP